MSRSAVKFMTISALSVASLLLVGCANNRVIKEINEQFQTPLVITKRQETKCKAPTLKEGDSAKRKLAEAIIEINDCDDKRSSLAATINEKNSEIEMHNKKVNEKLDGLKK